MFSMILSGGQKMIDYIDMQMGNRMEQTIDTKDVSKIPKNVITNEWNLSWSESCWTLTFWIFSAQLTSRFTADTVMNCIYGLESNDSIHSNLVRWFSLSLGKNIANVALSTFPILSCVYQPSFFPHQLTKWFYDTMNIAMEYRQQNQLNRNDFLDFLLQRKQVKNHTNDDMVAFAATFLFDGFETTSMILAQSLYHIAKNDQYQNELRAEIIKYFPNGMEYATADTINELQYLDNIVKGSIVSL